MRHVTGLFLLYAEIIIRQIADMEGISIGGQNVNNIRYAIDALLIADSHENLQRIIESVDATGEETEVGTAPRQRSGATALVV